MEWQAPAVILHVCAYGEGDALATLLTAEHGAWRGLARGGLSRAKAATWQAGNLVEARWVARLTDQLGSFTGDLAEPVAAAALSDPWRLAVLSAALAITCAALPEREPHPRVLAGLLRVLAHLPLAMGAAAELVRFETILLGELGFGLDLSACAVSGARENLAYVSPRTGRAVARDAAGEFRDRLLVLPEFVLAPDAPASPADLAAGLRLTGHFLARDLFGLQHKPVPAARTALADRFDALHSS